MLFEVGDLQYASPATVSRAGMVYVDPKNLNYDPYWQKWMNGRTNKAEHELFPGLFEKIVPQCIDLILDGMLDGKQGEKLSLICPQTNLNMVTQLCMMLESVLDPREVVTEPQILEAVFLECVYWSIGGTLTEASQPVFNDLVKRLCGLPSKSGGFSNITHLISRMRSQQQLFENSYQILTPISVRQDLFHPDFHYCMTTTLILIR